MSQSPKFQPITIVLETAEEADLLWEIIEAQYSQYPVGSYQRNFLIEMSNWFSLEAQLGGK